jgi:hypothetical protein
MSMPNNMPLRLDTDGVTFTVGSDFEPVTDFQTKRPKADANGVPLVQVSLVASFKTSWGKTQSEVLTVRLPEGKPLPPGALVRPVGLTAIPWSQNGKSGVAFRAGSLEPVSAAKAS